MTKIAASHSPAGVREARAALRALWPGEPPAEQMSLLASMSPQQRDAALRRLSAVLDYEAGGARDPATHAEAAGLGIRRFHSLRRAWQEDRSLLSLVPQAGGRKRSASAPSDEVAEAALDAVRRAFGDGAPVGEAAVGDRPSRESLAVQLHERFGSPSLGTFRKLVAGAARVVERELAGGFGRHVVIDSAALPLPLVLAGSGQWDADDASAEFEIEWAVAALCWDVATGRILGSALSKAPSTMALHAAAARSAATALRSMDVGGVAHGSIRIVTTMPSALDSMEQLREMTALGRMGVETDSAGAADECIRIVTTVPGASDPMEKLREMVALEERGAEAMGAYRGEGAELMKAFGGRLGPLKFRPRFAKDTFPGRTSRTEILARYGRLPMPAEDAASLLERAIRTHNAGADVVVAPPGANPAMVAERLDQAFGGFTVAPG